MYKKVMADMDKTTLLRMRDEEGMTLGEIASAVGCTKSTICRILGPMSPEQRRQRKQQGARSRWSSATEGGYTVERKLQSFMPQAEAAKEEPAAAVLAVKRAPILLSGAFMDYVVSADSQMIDVEKEGRTLIQIPAERLSEFIAELAAISRNIGEQKPMQFWGVME